MFPGGIDYSKWDHLEDSDGDAESESDVDPQTTIGRGRIRHDADGEHDRRTSRQPRVTRLDVPSRVATTPDGVITIMSTDTSDTSTTQSPADNMARTHSTQTPTPGSSTSEPQQQRQQQPTQPQHQKPANTSLASTIPDSWTTNGGFVESLKLYWSQDRSAVSLRFQLPQDADTKHISVQWKGKIHTYADRHMAVGSDNTASFQILMKQGHLFQQGDLPYPIHYNEDDDELDWEIDNREGRKYILLTLPKAMPMAGMAIRWSRPLKQLPPDESANSTTTTTQFQQTWEQAHTMFREKIAKAGN